MISEPTFGACPDLQTLSAYLDGKLDPAERVRIEDHISRCEDCYFVVRETTLVRAEAEAQDAKRPEKASSFVRYLMPIAATLVVAAGALALWRQVNPGNPYAEAVRPLVDAVGERRFFEPRLTGGFHFGPSVSAKRSSAGGPESEVWGVRAAAGELEKAATASTAGRASRAAAALFIGDVETALTTYKQLVQEEPDVAGWPSNLAAALLVRSLDRDGGPTPGAVSDRLSALRFAEQAVRIDPSLLEARFNQGLALKLLGRAEEARSVFAAAAARGDAWSAAALDELQGMAEPPNGTR